MLVCETDQITDRRPPIAWHRPLDLRPTLHVRTDDRDRVALAVARHTPRGQASRPCPRHWAVVTDSHSSHQHQARYVTRLASTSDGIMNAATSSTLTTTICAAAMAAARARWCRVTGCMRRMRAGSWPGRTVTRLCSMGRRDRPARARWCSTVAEPRRRRVPARPIPEAGQRGTCATVLCCLAPMPCSRRPLMAAVGASVPAATTRRPSGRRRCRYAP